MLRRYIFFSILTLIIISGRKVYQEVTDLLSSTQQMSEKIHFNGEGRLAFGKKLIICSATPAELELISGVSDSLAFRLYENRHEINAVGQQLPPKKDYQALEIVHGIGPKSAKKLSRFITTHCYR